MAQEPESSTLSPPPTPTKESNEAAKTTEEHEYPSTSKLWILMSSLYIAMFLVALDKTIIATAIPQITNSFGSLRDIGWYGSSYMITLCAFQLLWGRIYTFYSPKMVFLLSILIFEIGSAVCGAAPTSVAFIVGRAISGMGSAGISNGAIIIVVHTVPLAKRPMFQGLIGAVFGVASVVGPLLGGVFTERVTWRWCFYINLPLGAVSAIIIILILELPNPPEAGKLPIRDQLKKLDPIGTILFLPGTICLLLALQWGGTTYDWSEWRVVLLLVLFPILLLLFIIHQWRVGDNATLPIRIMTQRTIASGFLYTFTNQAALLCITYYIPLFFQALKNFSPLSSGLATLPTILGLVIGMIGAGGLVQRFGYPAPFMYVASILSSVGAGLISTWHIDASRGVWIGYQVLYGVGAGIGAQQPSISAQCILPKKDVSMGVSLMFFGQNMGAAVFLSAAQNVFAGSLAGSLSGIAGLHFTKEQVVNLGATQIRELVPKELLGEVLLAYRDAIRQAFLMGVGLAAVSCVGALGMEWVSVKKGEPTKEGGQKAEKEGDEEKGKMDEKKRGEEEKA
ncbi:major facilitator superfamily domain-containing protein [Clohesyomyces aquaticus]|uniref:Major facilitator superfamily domain-containing protein n=1 Tax=Clohesyomyces aquaticus TaxID=1231657 RepID=A0A1Y2A6J7_9PLEO|nr:major facilitator superfamily domain-containing protein [Clohesyomyces aquaticus]